MSSDNFRDDAMKADAHWLNRERLFFYSCIFMALFLFFSCFLWIFMFDNTADSLGQPIGFDFITFWAASHLALTGHAEDAYNSTMLCKAQQIGVPAANSNSYVWFYPPAFFLFVMPLALLPYLAAYWSFMFSTLGACFLLLHRIVRGNIAICCIASFSGLWLNLFCGQNAFLTAALGGAALLSMERKPLLAGLLVGLLAAIKPHLALLFPVALMSVGAWRTLITAALTVVTSTAFAAVILGIGVLKGFLANLGYARLLLENGSHNWERMSSVFAFMRLRGIPVTWAYVVHFIFATGAAIVVCLVWRYCRNWNLRGAALMTATFLVTPYAFFYDLVWLAFPIAWLALDGLRNGWLRGERELLIAAWMLPMLTVLSVQVAPLVLCSLLWMTYRRATAVSLMSAQIKGGTGDKFETIR
jgi:hypothetical protein